MSDDWPEYRRRLARAWTTIAVGATVFVVKWGLVALVFIGVAKCAGVL